MFSLKDDPLFTEMPSWFVFGWIFVRFGPGVVAWLKYKIRSRNSDHNAEDFNMIIPTQISIYSYFQVSGSDNQTNYYPWIRPYIQSGLLFYCLQFFMFLFFKCFMFHLFHIIRVKEFNLYLTNSIKWTEDNYQFLSLFGLKCYPV